MYGMKYDRDYFEKGLETGKSTYQNYTWMPQFTIPMAMTIIDYLGIGKGSSVLDYGCAKGYLVKALRMLYRNAWGIDVSKYAIDNLDSEVKSYCFLKSRNILIGKKVSKFPSNFDYCIAKDVFEHIEEPELRKILSWIESKFLFVVVPLGDGYNYNAPLNNLDSTHVHKWSIDIWEAFIEETGWQCIDKTFKVIGIKDSYYDEYPKAHGFLRFRNR